MFRTYCLSFVQRVCNIVLPQLK